MRKPALLMRGDSYLKLSNKVIETWLPSERLVQSASIAATVNGLGTKGVKDETTQVEKSLYVSSLIMKVNFPSVTEVTIGDILVIANMERQNQSKSLKMEVVLLSLDGENYPEHKFKVTNNPLRINWLGSEVNKYMEVLDTLTGAEYSDTSTTKDFLRSYGRLVFTLRFIGDKPKPVDWMLVINPTVKKE